MLSVAEPLATPALDKTTDIATNWECPITDDRDGSDGDVKNYRYVALMKELREVINTRGRDYIFTFTTLSSDQYLHHSNLKGIEGYVDWINLISYDLHNVQNSSNPFRKQVLSHTNLAEIDYTLDLVSVTGTLGIYLAPWTDTRTLCPSDALVLGLPASYSAWASMVDLSGSNLLRTGSPAVASRVVTHYHQIATAETLSYAGK